jgi:hypothetical protein
MGTPQASVASWPPAPPASPARTGRSVPCEGRLVYTAEIGVGGNLRRYIQDAQLPLLDGAADPRPALRELAARVVDDAFLDSANNARFQPFTSAGVRAQLLAVLTAIRPSLEEECARLAEAERAVVLEKRATALAKAAARQKLSITGYDPYPNQPGGAEFQATWKSLLGQAQGAAAQEASEAAAARLESSLASASTRALVLLAQQLRARYESMEQVADELLAQCRETTLLALAITKLDGVDVPQGPAGLVQAEPQQTDRPSLYHLGRQQALALACEMEREGQLDALGVSGPAVALRVPGMPPFFFGDATEGVTYALGGDYAQRMVQGNQRNDKGVHVTIFARPDAAGLALANEEYAVPDLARVQVLCRRGAEGEPYGLVGSPVPAVVDFELHTSACKLVQGQARNDALVGGDRYVALALPPRSWTSCTASSGTSCRGASSPTLPSAPT